MRARPALVTPRPARPGPPSRHPIVDELTHRAAGKAAELVRHGAARAVHVVGDWCQKIVGELDATAAHLNGDPAPAEGMAAAQQPPQVDQRAGPT